jgi:phosphatidylglycerophosphate synthase
MLRPRRRWLLALPNVLSFSRLVFAVVFAAVSDVPVRLACVVGAGASDFLDGWLARRRRAASRLGALIDPFTDRVFVVTAVVMFLAEGALSVRQCVLFLLRDVATALAFVVAKAVSWLRAVTFKARMLGKLVTVLQLLALLVLLVVPRAAEPLVVAVGALSVAAIVDYAYAVWRARAR